MAGFAAFANAVGVVILVVLPLLCYVSGSVLFITAGYGAWQSARPGSWWSEHKALPLLALLLGAMMLTFDRVLDKAQASFGGSVNFAMAPGLTAYSYTPPTQAGLLGSTPEQTVMNLVSTFIVFFIAFGALMCFLALQRLWGLGKGTARGGYSHPVIQGLFGLALINIHSVTAYIMANF